MIPYPYVLRRRMMIQDMGKLPPMGRGFANYTWAELDAISKAGLAADYFTVGETRSIDLSYVSDGVDYSGTYNLAIHDINHDDLADGSGKAGLTIGFNTVFTKYNVLHPTNRTDVFWGNCDMRTTYLPEYFSILPADLQAVIKTVNKIYLTQTDLTNIPENIAQYQKIVQDKLFLPSSHEFLDVSSSVFLWEGTQYPYLATEESRIKYDVSGVAQMWWTREMYKSSIDGEDGQIGVYVNENGATVSGGDAKAAFISDPSEINTKEETESFRCAAPLFCI